VRRLWAPRLQGETLWARAWRRVRGTFKRTSDAADVLPDGCEPDLGAIVIFLVLVAVVLLLFFVAIPLLVALIDIVLILLLTVLGIAARVVFRRPWVVEAVGPDSSRWRWRVVGWRASRRAVQDIADAVAHGHPPEAGHDSVPVVHGARADDERAGRPAQGSTSPPSGPPVDRPPPPPPDRLLGGGPADAPPVDGDGGAAS
jgi:hypothetical protein